MLSIVVPVYFEQDNILKLINQLDKFIVSSNEKVIVYDNKSDPTYSVLKDFVAKNKRSDIKLTANSIGNRRGALNALKTGFKQARGDAVVVVMADLSDDIPVIEGMYKLAKAGSKVVCASRYMKGGKQVGGPFIKRTLSRFAGVSLYYIRKVPTHDISNNFRLYDKKFLDSIKLESEGGFEIAMEITVKAFKRREKITEVPAQWIDREAGKSNFKLLKWLPSYIKWYLYALF